MGKTTLSGAANHRHHRNYFSPARGVIDGDFCEMFLALSETEKNRVSGLVNKDVTYLTNLLSKLQAKFS